MSTGAWACWLLLRGAEVPRPRRCPAAESAKKKGSPPTRPSQLGQVLCHAGPSCPAAGRSSGLDLGQSRAPATPKLISCAGVRQSSARHATTASADQFTTAGRGATSNEQRATSNEHGRARPTRDPGPVVLLLLVVGVSRAGEAGAGARAVATEPGVVAPAVRQRRRPWPRKQRLLVVLEVPVPLHRGVVQLALHREAEEQGRRRRGQEAAFAGVRRRHEDLRPRAVQRRRRQAAPAVVPELRLLHRGDPQRHQQLLAGAQGRAGRLRRRLQGRPPRRHRRRRQARQAADAQPSRGRGVPERDQDHGAHRAPEPGALLRLHGVRRGAHRRRRVRPQRNTPGPPRQVPRAFPRLWHAARHRHRRRARRHVPAHVLGPPHHPPRHQVLQHPPHRLAARQGGRLRLRAPGRHRGPGRGGRARHHPGEGHGGVPGPGVPQDVPAHGPQRRLLLRRAPRRARLRAPPHRDQARDEGAPHRALGHGQARRRRRRRRARPAPRPHARRRARAPVGARARVPVHGARAAGKARHERLLQGALGRQEDVPGHAGRRRHAALLHHRQQQRRPLEDLILILPSSCMNPATN